MTITVRPLALDDLHLAALAIAENNLTAAEAFYDEVEHLVTLLTEQPRLGQELPVYHDIVADVRSLLLRKYPYAILYRVIDNRQIEIIRVLHQRRDLRGLLS